MNPRSALATSPGPLGIAAALIVLLSAPATAHAAPIAKLSCIPGADYPSCAGWGAWGPNDYHTAVVVPGGGPQGQDAIQFDQLVAAEHAQYYLGWEASTGSDVAPGGARYIRFRFKGLSPIDLAGTGDVWGNKFIIVGDASGDDTSRVICFLRDNGMSSDIFAIACSRNIDGFPSATNLVELTEDTWQSVQIELQSSTSGASGDGRLAIWLDGASATYGSPTSESGMFQLNTTNWQNVRVGFYAGTTLAAGSHASYQIADFEWADAYDPAWHLGGSSTNSGAGGAGAGGSGPGGADAGGSSGPGAGTGAGTADAASGAGTGGSSGPAAGSGGSSSDDPNGAPDESGGCSLGASPSAPSGAAALLGLAMLAARARRRRR